MSDLWIVIPKWEEFQHYKDRDPTWIKTYRSQLDNPDYLDLTFAQRGLLHDLRLLYALSATKVRVDERKLGKRLNRRVTKQNLETLNQAGFIALRASTRREELEREEGTLLASEQLERIRGLAGRYAK